MTGRSPDEDAVLSTCQAFLDGIKNKNKAAMLAQIIPEGSGILSRPDQTLHLSLAAVVERIPFDAPQQLEEPIYDPLIRIDHDLAMLWARYDFFIDGSLHHVGANIFSLLKRDDRWLISGVADTWRKPDTP